MTRYQPGNDRTSRNGSQMTPIAVGDRIGRLRVLSIDRRAYGKRAAQVQCSCGSPEKLIRLEHLQAGQIKSCGCLRAERLQRAAEKRRDGVW